MTDKKHDAPLERWWENSPSYIKAYEDIEFLNRNEVRPVRLQLELLKTELAMQAHDVRSTIVVFGGTRILSPQEASARVNELEKRWGKNPGNDEAARDLEIARNIQAKSKYYEEARAFGRMVSEAGQAGTTREYVVVTGGGPGVMAAANRGAYETGAKSIGLNITLPHEQQPNPYITPELCFQFHYFAIRKMHFMLRAKALVAFPGGYGTMDELFEALTLVQTRKVKRLPIVLMAKSFWDGIIHFERFVTEGVIDPEDVELFHFAETAQEAWDYIQSFWRLNNENGEY
jgi:uncharacterized protein (TIGR00730 family)